MASLAQEIGTFLTENGLSHSVRNDRGCEVIAVEKPQLIIFPIEVNAGSAEEAQARSEEAWKRIKEYTDVHGYPVIITEDTNDDLPDPLKPVMTTNLWRGIERSMFFRLCTRAPRI